MSGEDFARYWANEAEPLEKQGVYQWLARFVEGKRVLEIGCGLGHGTQVLVKQGAAVLAIDREPACLEATGRRLQAAGMAVSYRPGEADGPGASLFAIDLLDPSAEAGEALAAFRPDWVVCWFMGTPEEAARAATGAGARPEAVQGYRNRVQRIAAEWGTRLSSVRAFHIADRTAIPWRIREFGRQTLANFHAGQTFLGLPFSCAKDDAFYRRLEGKGVAGPMGQIVPVIGALTARRTK